MRIHELLERIILLLFLTSRFPLPLHLLVVHHLLDHAAGLAVQVAQLGVLGLDLGHVDLGRRRHHVRPPFRLVLLVQVDRDLLARGGRGRLQRPGAFVREDGAGEVALESCMLVLFFF